MSMTPSVDDREHLAHTLVPIAARLVATVRDYGPDDVVDVLRCVPAGRFDALAVILAGMVDPDATPADLLAWTEEGPVRSPLTVAAWQSHPLPREHGSERGYYQHRSRGEVQCAPCRRAHALRTAERKARRVAETDEVAS